MRESKLDCANRLRKDGRWPAASLWKDEKIRELRAAGKRRPEAQVEAWQAVTEKFPPIEKPEIPENPEEDEPVDTFSEEEVEIIAGLPIGSLRNFSADSSWVYSNLEGDADIGSAPSAGAAGLLRWARENRDDFYGKILPKALQISEKRHGQDAEDVEAKRLNLKHVNDLFERCHGRKPLEEWNELYKATEALRETKGFAHDDYLGFARYLRGIIEEE